MAATAIGVILEELERRREALSSALTDGSARDYAEYQGMCGEIRGLTHATAYIKDLVQRQENGEDD